jgi:hypothetical protein
MLPRMSSKWRMTSPKERWIIEDVQSWLAPSTMSHIEYNLRLEMITQVSSLIIIIIIMNKNKDRPFNLTSTEQCLKSTSSFNLIKQ